MTTETLETTATTTEAPVVPVVEAPKSTPVETPAEDHSAAALELLKELGETEAEAEAEASAAGTKSPPATPVAPEVEAKAAELFAAKETERAQQAEATQRANYEAGIRKSFQDRLPAINAYLRDLGVDEESRQRVLNEFNYHDGQSRALSQFDTAIKAREFQDILYAQVGEVLPKDLAKALVDARAEHTSTAKFLKDVVAKARDGYLTPKQAKAEADLRMQKYTEKLLKEGRLSGGRTLEAGGATPSANGSYTLAAIEAMPTSQWLAIGDAATRQGILNKAHQQAGR